MAPGIAGEEHPCRRANRRVAGANSQVTALCLENLTKVTPTDFVTSHEGVPLRSGTTPAMPGGLESIPKSQEFQGKAIQPQKKEYTTDPEVLRSLPPIVQIMLFEPVQLSRIPDLDSSSEGEIGLRRGSGFGEGKRNGEDSIQYAGIPAGEKRPPELPEQLAELWGERRGSHRRLLTVILALVTLASVLVVEASGVNIAASLTPVSPDGGSLPAISSAGGGDPSGANCNCTGYDSTSKEQANSSTWNFLQFLSFYEPECSGSGCSVAVHLDVQQHRREYEKANNISAGALGYGWSDNLGMSLSENLRTTKVVTITQENGSQIVFDYLAMGASESSWCPSDSSAPVYCVTAPRSIATLTQGSSTWTLTLTSSPITYTFSSSSGSGVLTEIENAQYQYISLTCWTRGTGECQSSSSSCTVWTSSASGRSITLNFSSGGSLLSAIDNVGNTTAFCDFGQTCSPSSGGQTGDLMSITQFSGTSAF